MNREDPYRDQAERLRKKIERNKSVTTTSRKEIPPRSRVHSRKRNKNTFKLKYPVIRLLVLFFILLPVTIFSAYNYLNGKDGGIGNSPVKSSGYETISVEKGEDKAEGNDNQENLPVRIEEKEPETKEASSSVNPAPLPDDSVATVAESKDIPAPSADKKQTSKVTAPGGQSENSTEPKPAPQKNDPAASAQPNESEPKQNEPTAPAQPMEPDPKQNEKLVYHTVQSGETLFRVAMKYYHSQAGIEIIRQANNLQGNEIQLGQVLKIPLKE